MRSFSARHLIMPRQRLIEERIGKMTKDKKDMIFWGGIAVLIIGIWMILAWWPHVVSFFKGFLGIAVAIGGLLMMYTKKV